MRSVKRSKTYKKPYSQRIIKRRRRRVSNLRCPWGVWGCPGESSDLFLNDINEVIRDRKAHRFAELKGPWRLVPKDSCEVYKQRRKRKFNRQKFGQYDDEADSRDRDSVTSSGDSDNDKKYKGKDRKNQPRKKQPKKKMPPKKAPPKMQRSDATKGQQRKVQRKPSKPKRRPRRCMHASASSTEFYSTGSDMDYD